MRIGIITFHNSYNCGSILQCMALKKILELEGENVEIIHFSTPSQQKLYSVLYRKLTLKNIIKNFLCLPGYKVIKEHYKQYQEYIYDVFNLNGAPYESTEELRKNLPSYDMLIAGGDQVWNIHCEDFSTAYFLDFNDTAYKISYSPSLGATNLNLSEKASEYKNLLMKFDAISCRETNGAKWLKAMTGKNIELLLDPTMLLNKDVWKLNIKETLSLPFEGEYIFYYAFAYSAENNQAVQKIAEESNCKVVVIDAKQWYIKGLKKYKNFILCDETGPNAFLNLMNGAKYIITTSFHGTVFSLLFEKKFIYINSKNHESTDDRTSFLLEQLDLMDRYVFSEKVSIPLLEKNIDYIKVNMEIDSLRQKAFAFIRKHIEKAKTKELKY